MKVDKKLFTQKIKRLSTDKLLTLLRTTHNPFNNEIHALAKEEVVIRNLAVPYTTPVLPDIGVKIKTGELSQLKKWNWGAFFLAPIWALTNKVYLWVIILCIPGINIIAHFFLGLKGNKIAFPKSDLESVEDFMKLQKYWSTLALRFFWAFRFPLSC